MTEDEMKNKYTERAKIFQQAMESCKSSSPMDCIEWFADRIAELEEKISILLSCKNCPENKGGYICVKEYENKCLAQKIQHIKELQEEIAELKSGCGMCYRKDKENLTKAKEIIKKLIALNRKEWIYSDVRVEAEQFLSEVGK